MEDQHMAKALDALEKELRDCYEKEVYDYFYSTRTEGTVFDGEYSRPLLWEEVLTQAEKDLSLYWDDIDNPKPVKSDEENIATDFRIRTMHDHLVYLFNEYMGYNEAEQCEIDNVD